MVDSSPRGGGRKRKRRDREVLDAAAQIFYERGYANATVQDIADALGILKGSLYHYTDSKEDLLFRLLEEVHREVEAVREQARAGDGLDPIGRVYLYVRQSVRFNVHNALRMTVYYDEVERLSKDRRELILGYRRTHESFLTGLIVEAQQANQVDASLDPTMLSNFIFGAIIWMYRWYRPGGEISPGELGDACSRFVLAGLGASRYADSTKRLVNSIVEDLA